MNFSALKGRLLQVFHDGLRIGRVVSVRAGKRIGLRSVRLAGPSYDDHRFAWNGPKYRVESNQVRGVLFRGKVLGVNEFLKGRA